MTSKKPCGANSAVLTAILLLLTSPLSASGLELEAVYTGEIWRNASGGLDEGSRYLDNFDLTMSVDLGETWLDGAGTLYAHALYNNATTFSDELVGDLQVVSNIEAPEALRLFEFWYDVGSGPWSIRTGLYDLNSEFDAHDTGGLFIKSSHGIGPEISQTGQNGPSIFPISGLAVRGAYSDERYTARIAVLDAVPGDPDDPASNKVDLGDGALTIAELDIALNERWRLWSGAWRYSSEFERLRGPGIDNDNHGFYAGTEWTGELRARQAGWFLRLGFANEDINPVKSYFGTGLVVNGPFQHRPNDQIGIALALVVMGRPYRQLLIDDGLGVENERIIEMTYRAAVNDWLTLQPNLQLVKHPSGTSSIDDAVVFGLRFELSWGVGG